MAVYKIIHREELVGWYYVEADSEEEAIAEFEYLSSEGQIDYSDMEMTDASNEIELVPENDMNDYIRRQVLTSYEENCL